MNKFILFFAMISAVTIGSCNQQNSIDAVNSKPGVFSDEYLKIYLGQISLSKMDISQVDIAGNN